MRGVVGRGGRLLGCGSHAQRGECDGIGGWSRGFGRRSDDARRSRSVDMVDRVADMFSCGSV